MTTGTAYVVYCEAHGHYLRFASAGGTTWRSNQDEARRYATKPAAAKDAKVATWLDHRPIVCSLSGLLRCSFPFSAQQHSTRPTQSTST